MTMEETSVKALTIIRLPEKGQVVFGGNSTTANIVSINAVMSRTPTANSAPAQNIARKPDTGFAGTQIILQVLFYEGDVTAPEIATLRNWYIQDGAIAGSFKNGRFGIKNDYRPEFNLDPGNGAGYKLVHFEVNQELKHNDFVPGTIILEFSGDPSELSSTDDPTADDD